MFSSADLNSGTSAGSPVLLVRWKVLLPHVKDPKPKLLEDSTTVLAWEIKVVREFHSVNGVE